jgi:hypothetical protein
MGEEKQSSSFDIDQLRARKEQLEEDLRAIEKQIYDLEEHYIDETYSYGNVIRGWDNFLTARVPRASVAIRESTQQSKSRRQPDRIFSQSSVSAPLGDS